MGGPMGGACASGCKWSERCFCVCQWGCLGDERELGAVRGCCVCTRVCMYVCVHACVCTCV